MKRAILLFVLLIGLLIIPYVSTLAQDGAVEIQLLSTFDYPDVNVVNTFPRGINDAGDVVGSLSYTDGSSRGFIRYADGSFSDPLVEPNDTRVYTVATGISNDGVICGYYGNSIYDRVGFFLTGATYSEFLVPGLPSTDIQDINDAGNFVGQVYRSPETKAYAGIGGSPQFVKLPAAEVSYAFGINNANEVTGYYTDQSQTPRNFFQDSAGTVTFVKAPNILFPLLRDLNDSRMIVGVGSTGSPQGVGIVFRYPRSQVATYSYPGGGSCEFTGINNNNVICGDYQDKGGLGRWHGLLVQAVPR